MTPETYRGLAEGGADQLRRLGWVQGEGMNGYGVCFVNAVFLAAESEAHKHAERLAEHGEEVYDSDVEGWAGGWCAEFLDSAADVLIGMGFDPATMDDEVGPSEDGQRICIWWNDMAGRTVDDVLGVLAATGERGAQS